MKIYRKGGICHLVITNLIKSIIIILSTMGIFSLLCGLFGSVVDNNKEVVNRKVEEDTRAATEDRRDKVYEDRRSHAASACQIYEDDITLHTVKMYDLVPPAPIGLNADILVSRPKKFFWCKVPKAASTSWISLLLSDRDFANLKVSIGRQHMYLRKLMPPPKTIEELWDIQNNFFSFLTVRHPFERLLSAYRDKFFVLTQSDMEKNKADKFYHLYGRKIIQTFRNASGVKVDKK